MVVVFTDLDGSLLNHDDYSYADALPALEKIKRKKIPLVFTTSKTRPEVEILQQEIGIDEPFIIENGAAVFFPENYRNFNLAYLPQTDRYRVIILGERYEKIRQFVEKVKDRYKIKGFGDMTVEEIAQLTDLPVEKAELAKKREFTEPFIIQDESLIPQLQKEAEKSGLKITKGGRFYHLIGKGQDKGKAVVETISIFKKHTGQIKTVGVGDSKNDEPMLKIVDIPVLIPKINNTYENIKIKGLIRASYPGSKGWNEVIGRLVDELEGNSSKAVFKGSGGSKTGKSNS
ncbi:HAD-IIB family hydrolase [Persephonella sp.]